MIVVLRSCDFVDLLDVLALTALRRLHERFGYVRARFSIAPTVAHPEGEAMIQIVAMRGWLIVGLDLRDDMRGVFATVAWDGVESLYPINAVVLGPKVLDVLRFDHEFFVGDLRFKIVGV